MSQTALAQLTQKRVLRLTKMPRRCDRSVPTASCSWKACSAPLASRSPPRPRAPHCGSRSAAPPRHSARAREARTRRRGGALDGAAVIDSAEVELLKAELSRGAEEQRALQVVVLAARYEVDSLREATELDLKTKRLQPADAGLLAAVLAADT